MQHTVRSIYRNTRDKCDHPFHRISTACFQFNLVAFEMKRSLAQGGIAHNWHCSLHSINSTEMNGINLVGIVACYRRNWVSPITEKNPGLCKKEITWKFPS